LCAWLCLCKNRRHSSKKELCPPDQPIGMCVFDIRKNIHLPFLTT
jgi:hypothetical protein